MIQQMASEAEIAPKVLTYTKDYIIMEYIDGITVEQYLEQCESDQDIELIYDIILNAIDKLHSLNIKHNDLMTSNIIITKNGKIMIIDYGSSEYNEDFTEDELFEDNLLL